MMMMSRRHDDDECLLRFAHDYWLLHGRLTVAATMIEGIAGIGERSMGHIDVLLWAVLAVRRVARQSVRGLCHDCANGSGLLRWFDSVDQGGDHVR